MLLKSKKREKTNKNKKQTEVCCYLYPRLQTKSITMEQANVEDVRSMTCILWQPIKCHYFVGCQ